MITIPKEQHEKLLRAAATAETATQKLREELEAERAKTETERLDDAKQLIGALRTIVDHATANLSPEFIVDLPAEAFYIAAGCIDKVMGATQRDAERSLIWRGRADDIVKWREQRKARNKEGQSVPPPARKKVGILGALRDLATNVAEEVDEFRRSIR
jgi:hypothetical protein